MRSRIEAVIPFNTFTAKPDFTPYTALVNLIPLDEMNPPLAQFTGLQIQLAEFSMTVDSSKPDESAADPLNRAIWHSVKGFDTPYNYGKALRRQHSSFESLLRMTGN